MSDDTLNLLSAALDEIYRLRRALAYEAAVVDAHLGYKTFPKTRRTIAEQQAARMRTGVVSTSIAYGGVNSQSLHREALRCGFERLTVSSWAEELAAMGYAS